MGDCASPRQEGSQAERQHSSLNTGLDGEQACSQSRTILEDTRHNAEQSTGQLHAHVQQGSENGSMGRGAEMSQVACQCEAVVHTAASPGEHQQHTRRIGHRRKTLPNVTALPPTVVVSNSSSLTSMLTPQEI